MQGAIAESTQRNQKQTNHGQTIQHKNVDNRLLSLRNPCTSNLTE